MTDEQAKKLAGIRARLEKPSLTASEYNHLSKKDQKRYDKLTGILAKLKANETVYTSDLKRWLGDAYEGIAATWEYEKVLRKDYAEIPSELKDFEAKLRRGDLFANRRDGKNKAQNKAAVMDDYADKAFDDAADFLQSILEEHPEYAMYLDRDVSLEAGHEDSIAYDEIGIPRLITSRSANRLSNGQLQTKRSKQDIKIEVVEDVLSGIVESVRYTGVIKQSDQSEKLKKLLNNWDNEDDF